MRRQVALVVKASRIAEVAGELQLDGETDSFAVAEDTSVAAQRPGCATTVNSKANAGVGSGARAIAGHDFFGRDVEALPDLVGSTFPYLAFPRDMRRQFHRLAIREWFESHIEERCRTTELYVKRSREEEH